MAREQGTATTVFPLPPGLASGATGPCPARRPLAGPHHHLQLLLLPPPPGDPLVWHSGERFAPFLSFFPSTNPLLFSRLLCSVRDLEKKDPRTQARVHQNPPGKGEGQCEGGWTDPAAGEGLRSPARQSGGRRTWKAEVDFFFFSVSLL